MLCQLSVRNNPVRLLLISPVLGHVAAAVMMGARIHGFDRLVGYTPVPAPAASVPVFVLALAASDSLGIAPAVPVACLVPHSPVPLDAKRPIARMADAAPLVVAAVAGIAGAPLPAVARLLASPVAAFPDVVALLIGAASALAALVPAVASAQPVVDAGGFASADVAGSLRMGTVADLVLLAPVVWRRGFGAAIASAAAAVHLCTTTSLNESMEQVVG